MFLKECPFCGKIIDETSYFLQGTSAGWRVECPCGGQGPLVGSRNRESDAICAWNNRYSSHDVRTFEAGQTYRASFTTDGSENVHILYVLPSLYEELKLIVYKFWDRGHAIWIEKMCTDEEMTTFIKRAKEAKE